MAPLGVSADRFFHLDGWNGWSLRCSREIEAGTGGLTLAPAGLPASGMPDRPLRAEGRGLAFDWAGQVIAVSVDGASLCGASGAAGALPEPGLGRYRGLAVDARGYLYVARDTGVVHVLRASPTREIARITGIHAAAIAAAGPGLLFVLDASGHASPAGVPPGVTLVRVAASGDAIAATDDGLVAVVRAESGEVLMGRPGALASFSLGRPALPAIAFDRSHPACEGEAIVFVGDALSGKIVRWHLRDGIARPLAWSEAVCAWSALAYRGAELFGLGEEEGEESDPCAVAVRAVEMEAAGFHACKGDVVLGPLDSGVPGTEWHRVTALVARAEGTRVFVQVLADDDPDAYDQELDQGDDARWTREVPLAFPREDRPGEIALLARSRRSSPDSAAIAAPGPHGRYAWIRITLRGDGRRTPRVHWVRAECPRTSYLRYLPRIYSDEPESRDLLARFLSIFEAENTDLNAQIDGLYRLFSPLVAEPDLLPWLARRIGLRLPREWSVPEQRRALSEALPLYRKRGTLGALQTMLGWYGGPGIRVVESVGTRAAFLLGSEGPACCGPAILGATTLLPGSGEPPPMRLGAAPALGEGRLDPGLGGTLGEAIPARPEIVVYVPAAIAASPEGMVRVAHVVDREAPAGAAVRIVPLQRGVALGLHGRLGLSTALERRAPFLLPTGGRPPLLAREPEMGTNSRLGQGPRLGMDARL